MSGIIAEQGYSLSCVFLLGNNVRFLAVDRIREYIPKDSLLEQFLLVALLFLIIWLFNKSFKLFLKRAERHGFDRAAIPLVSDLVKYTTYALGLLVALNILGVNTNGLLAMLGAASLAVGLALKDTLSNIASGLLLMFLRPFKSGDYIECGSIKGKIKGIGLFSTTLVSLDGLYVSAPNSSLWGSPIVNFSRNATRRIEITVGIDYGDSTDKALAIMRDLVENEPLFLKTPCPQYFVSALADSSVNVTFRAWVRNSDYFDLMWKYTDEVKQRFDAAGITIPFPQRTVHLEERSNEVASL